MRRNNVLLVKSMIFSALLVFSVGCDGNRKRLSKDGKKWKVVLSEHNGSVSSEEAIVDFDQDGYLTLTTVDGISRGIFRTKGSDSIKIRFNDEEGVFNARYYLVEDKLKLEGLVDKKDTLYWELVEIRI